jgi:hypothetical protein
MRTPLRSLLFLVALLAALLPAAADRAPIGEALGVETVGEGELVFVQRTLVGEGVFNTLDLAAVVYLDNGRAMRFDANTAAKLRALEGDRVEVLVLSGRVTLLGLGSRPATAGAGSKLVLDRGNDDPEAVARLEAALDRRD